MPHSRRDDTTGIPVKLRLWVSAAELVTRPVHPETVAALHSRWNALPKAVRTPAQNLGRHAIGCEGTHGVFPRCNLACTPCYHSRDANQVRVDGQHTITEVVRQMALLRKIRGPRAHAQLIGGEVSLLPPEDHAEVLTQMRAHGREPMSMTHGDFDYPYLEALAVAADGTGRLPKLSFAAHFDMLMFGRRGIERPTDEASLNPHRERFTAMFERLRKDHGVRSFLAHNMTVTPTNLGQIADVIKECHSMGFGLFSFQPAAFVGDHRRWHESYDDTTGDDVWAQIEAGAGARLPYAVMQTGDVRCNRTTYGFFVGPDYFPYLQDDDSRDLRVRDLFYSRFGGMNFSGTPVPLLAVKVGRVVAGHPQVAVVAIGWAARMARTVGIRRLARYRPHSVTFVMHSFMDAADVVPAWEATLAGQTSADPRIAATQERLAACSYAMAHPETGELVPACVQHSVLDPQENQALRQLLPMPRLRKAASAPVA
ncbi:MAG: hypothetical protein ABI360_05600 [Allobranchiibius sp.]